MKKYKNKYRIASTRLRNWDYGWNALYFVTICTKNRVCWFGEVRNGTMLLSEIGAIAKAEWLKTFTMRPDMNLWMGEYVVMPNHFHAVIGIGRNQYNVDGDGGDGDGGGDGGDGDGGGDDGDGGGGDGDGGGDDGDGGGGRDAMHCVSTSPPPPKNQFGPQSKNLASIIRGFKIGVTKNARQINPDFTWQPRYHDHIIRDDKSLHRISQYILNNPSNWKEDKFHFKS